MPPGMFIAVAEESDLIVDLGAWVLSESCRLLARETMAGKPLKLSINISPRQFRQRGFVPWVKDLLAATGADPTQLTLEVTEGLVIEGIDNVVAKMSELAALGIRFSIDDFGTGYSSLSYLKRMPIHELKIDKSFVQDAPRDPNDGALVETILSVARHLHLQVVAEGVETEEQFAFLSRHGTVIFQGYLFGKPAPAEDWLARWQACDDRGTPS
jgi:EAL domain-containing protein (putative c-di-GMP-specific phosphodiesterase class I)